MPATVLINPVFEIAASGSAGNWEGCLSVPGMRGYVVRPDCNRYSGYGADGRRIERDAEGFHATVFQHEYDHLDGILYTDRLQDRTLFGFTDELAAADAIGQGAVKQIMAARASAALPRCDSVQNDVTVLRSSVSTLANNTDLQ